MLDTLNGPLVSSAAVRGPTARCPAESRRRIFMAMRTPETGQRRFPARELFRFLVLPVVLTIVVILVFMKPWRSREPAREGAYEQVLLVRKGGLSAITSLFGGASGSVWYTPGAPSLSLRLSAEKLTPGRRYIFEIQVDSMIYDVVSRAADDDGRLALDTSLAVVAEGTCVGDNYDPPLRFESGHSYSIGFMLKRDGNASTGTQRVPGRGGAPATELQCRGNGDGDYSYALLENTMARFTPRAAP